MHFIQKALKTFSFLALLALTACSFSTAADILPPTDAQVEPPATQMPTTAPTPAAATAEQSAATAIETSQVVEATPQSSDQTDGGITFTGSVENLSGGEIPATLQVVLQGFEGMNMIMTQTTEINADGTFTFEPVENAAELVFIATVEYEGLIFGSDIVHAGDLQPGDTAELAIAVYDKTDDGGDLFADRAHVFIEFLSENRLQVVEYLLISNPTNLVVAGSTPEEPALRFILPEEATNLQFEDSGMTARFIPIDGGFGDLMSVRPGLQQHEILFAYELPYTGKLSLELNFPVDVLSGTLVVPEGIKVKSDQVTESTPQEMEMGMMQIFNTGQLPKDEPLSLNLSGKSGATAVGSETNNRTGLAIGLGAFAVVLIVSGLWLSRKPKQAEDLEEVEPESETEEAILDKIIALDQAYEADSLEEEDYRQQRQELKERLSAIHSQ